MRMWMGIWPPSKPTLRLAPERAPAPLWPRPDVLPSPEPSPRPTRLRAFREPGFGFRLCRPIRSVVSVSFVSAIDLHQVSHAVQHPADLLVVLDLDRVADLAQPERPQGLALRVVRAVLRLDLRHLGHQAVTSAGSLGSSAASRVSPSSAAALSVRPSTRLTETPRSSATSSG